jgi:hypothetical protein
MKIESFNLPAHWAFALINGDESGLYDDDFSALRRFEAWMIGKYGQCWCVSCSDELQFMRWHDAADFGVLACDVLSFSFDVRPWGRT